MSSNRNTVLAAAIAIQLLFAVPAAAAEERPGNWSLDLKGGITSGHFTFDSKITGQGGFNLRYSMNPLGSFYGTFEVGQFRASESLMEHIGFTNDYFSIGVGVRLNVLRMLAGSAPLTERFAVYTTTGLNLMRADVRVNSTQLVGYAGKNYTGRAMVLRIGAGTAYRISSRLDLFMQAELNHSDSDLLDGYERLPVAPLTGLLSGGDSFINTSIGISVKLGGTGARHSDWHFSDYRSGTPSPAFEAEIARMKAELERSDRIKNQFAERLQSLNQTLNEFSHLFYTTYQEQVVSHENQLVHLQNRLDLLQSELEELSGRPDVPVDVGSEGRFFIVAGVFRNRDNAERLLQQLTADGFGQAGIETDRRRDYHVVVYNSYPTREQADTVLARIRNEVNPESWIFVK